MSTAEDAKQLGEDIEDIQLVDFNASKPAKKKKKKGVDKDASKKSSKLGMNINPLLIMYLFIRKCSQHQKSQGSLR